MTTVPKILTTFAVAAAIAAGLLAVPSAADARTHRHHYYSYRHDYFGYYRPYAFYPRYRRAPFYDYGGAYAYQPAYRRYPRVPIYNHDDATKLDRQLMGVGDSNH
jgi:hypothetical protein